MSQTSSRTRILQFRSGCFYGKQVEIHLLAAFHRLHALPEKKDFQLFGG